MWPSDPDRWKGMVNSLAVIALLLGLLIAYHTSTSIPTPSSRAFL